MPRDEFVPPRPLDPAHRGSVGRKRTRTLGGVVARERETERSELKQGGFCKGCSAVLPTDGGLSGRGLSVNGYTNAVSAPRESPAGISRPSAAGLVSEDANADATAHNREIGPAVSVEVAD